MSTPRCRYGPAPWPRPAKPPLPPRGFADEGVAAMRRWCRLGCRRCPNGGRRSDVVGRTPGIVGRPRVPCARFERVAFQEDAGDARRSTDVPRNPVTYGFRDSSSKKNANAKETWLGQTALMWEAAEGHVDGCGVDRGKRRNKTHVPRADSLRFLRCEKRKAGASGHCKGRRAV